MFLIFLSICSLNILFAFADDGFFCDTVKCYFIYIYIYIYILKP